MHHPHNPTCVIHLVGRKERGIRGGGVPISVCATQIRINTKELCTHGIGEEQKCQLWHQRFQTWAAQKHADIVSNT